MTLILNGTDNSATTPAVTGTDTDTGVYYPAANQVALATNGTLVLVADVSQNVGIAKSAPVARLHLAGTGTSGQVTASFIIENLSSGTMGVDITGTAGSSVARFRYGGGPGTGTNSMTGTFMTAGLEGVSAGTQGIYFAPTQVTSADANTLDDYEEGTWTPTYGGSVSNPTVTYQNNLGTYTKVGRQVTLIAEIHATSASGGSGVLTVNGFPFTTSSSGGARSGFLNSYATGFSSTTTPTSMLLESSATYCQARTNATSDARSNKDVDVTVSAIYSGGRLFLSMTYFTN
jgi:hypothetical protein